MQNYSKMQIEQVRQEDTLILKLTGRLDTTTAPLLQEIIEGELEGVTSLLLEMRELVYMSSAGLRVLLLAYKKLKNQGGIIKIQNANKQVQDAMVITGLTRIMNIQ